MLFNLMSLIVFIVYISLMGWIIVNLKIRFVDRLIFFFIICLLVPFIELVLISSLFYIYNVFTSLYRMKILFIGILILLSTILNYRCVSSILNCSYNYLYKITYMLISFIYCYISAILLKSHFFKFVESRPRMTINSYGSFKLYFTLLWIFILATILWYINYIISVILVYIFNEKEVNNKLDNFFGLVRKTLWYCYPNNINKTNLNIKRIKNRIKKRYIRKLIYKSINPICKTIIYIICFILYGFSYICGMRVILIYKFGKYFNVNIKNSEALSIIKLVSVSSMIFPVGLMLLILFIYSTLFKTNHINMKHNILKYDLRYNLIDTGIESFGITSIVLAFLNISKNPYYDVKILILIFLIVSIMLLGYTAKFIAHCEFIEYNSEYYFNRSCVK